MYDSIYITFYKLRRDEEQISGCQGADVTTKTLHPRGFWGWWNCIVLMIVVITWIYTWDKIHGNTHTPPPPKVWVHVKTGEIWMRSVVCLVEYCTNDNFLIAIVTWLWKMLTLGKRRWMVCWNSITLANSFL